MVYIRCLKYTPFRVPLLRHTVNFVQINVICVLLLRILEAQRGYHTLKKCSLFLA